jgi:DNA mismatch repair protein MutS
LKSDALTSDAPLFAHAGVSLTPSKHDLEALTEKVVENPQTQDRPLKASTKAVIQEPSSVLPPGTPATLETVNKADLPPMMQRYVEYKATYPDAILFFQVGDFFELFFEDAVTVSKALNLTLTSRDKNNPNPIPMCGVPLAVLDSYVDRLLPLGYAVAVVTQTGSGSGVDRTLERFVTPGMRLFSSVNSDSSESIISAISIDSDGRTGAIAYCDPQTGEILVKETVEISHLPRELDALHARECIAPRVVQGEKIDRRTGWVKKLEIVVGTQSLRFRPEPLATTSSLPGVTPSGAEGFLTLGTCAKRAVRQLLAYLDEVSLGNIVPIRSVSQSKESGMMLIDAHTRRNLELVQNSKDGSITGTLFEFINRTSTPGGARQLRNWLLHPLCIRTEITKRQDAVEALHSTCDDLIRLLSGLSDVERLAARVELGIASPRDLASLRDVLERLPQIRESIARATGDTPSELLTVLSNGIVAPPEILNHLASALVDSPPPTLQDGGVIRSGFDRELDEIRAIRSTADEWRAAFEASQRAATGVTSLKVKSNNVIGFFIEVPTAHSPKMPPHFQRRQSTANADRFTTPELREHEQSVITAVDRQVRRENLLFVELRKGLQRHNDLLRGIARALAELDALVALAVTASRSGLVRPTVVEEPVLKIEHGWHPVIATLLEGRFVPNSVRFDTEGPSSFLVTGPNMGGKSTYLRQTALIVILAQMGSFVPAKIATVGVSDKVFARLGASDDLHEGESTFMVEMREAAHILSAASRRSLVLIDELGRGTATSDGLSLAQAILEEICSRIKCRTLFATHYHELTVLEEKGLPIGNLSVGSIEEDTRVIFTHEIQSGPAPRSYGLEVAKLSGLPSNVLERAEDLLEAAQVGAEGGRESFASSSDQLIPARPRIPKIDPAIVAIVSTIKNLDPNALTPRDALSALFELSELARTISGNGFSVKDGA